jgi:NAD(P)-dependent dehydrogenase (short-subunit alcohol dehydrogenase family)
MQEDFIMEGKKVVLVAGASSGLGLATADYLFEKGFTVYAGARSYKGEKGEKNGGGGGALRKRFLDVTDEKSIDALVREIVEKEGRIDALVNAFALIILGSAEDISMDEFKKVMDTNFFGTVGMCRRVLPHMRERGRGLIVNFSSGAGLIGIPFQGAYCSSKFAIEGFSEALRWETKNFGIDVVLVEPGDNRAGSEKYRLHAGNADSEQSPYYEDFRTVTGKIASDEANGAYPGSVAKTVCKILNARKPKIRYRVFRLMEKMLSLKMVLPSGVVEAVFFGYYNLKPKKPK